MYVVFPFPHYPIWHPVNKYLYRHRPAAVSILPRRRSCPDQFIAPPRPTVSPPSPLSPASAVSTVLSPHRRRALANRLEGTTLRDRHLAL